MSSGAGSGSGSGCKLKSEWSDRRGDGELGIESSWSLSGRTGGVSSSSPLRSIRFGYFNLSIFFCVKKIFLISSTTLSNASLCLLVLF